MQTESNEKLTILDDEKSGQGGSVKSFSSKMPLSIVILQAVIALLMSLAVVWAMAPAKSSVQTSLTKYSTEAGVKIDAQIASMNSKFATLESVSQAKITALETLLNGKMALLEQKVSTYDQRLTEIATLSAKISALEVRINTEIAGIDAKINSKLSGYALKTDLSTFVTKTELEANYVKKPVAGATSITTGGTSTYGKVSATLKAYGNVIYSEDIESGIIDVPFKLTIVNSETVNIEGLMLAFSMELMDQLPSKAKVSGVYTDADIFWVPAWDAGLGTWKKLTSGYDRSYWEYATRAPGVRMVANVTKKYYPTLRLVATSDNASQTGLFDIVAGDIDYETIISIEGYDIE